MQTMGQSGRYHICPVTPKEYLVTESFTPKRSKALFIVSSAKNKPPVLPGEMKSFSKNKTGEL